MRMKLTDQAINKAARDAEADGKRREVSDLGCPGLRIRITPTGGRSWILGARDKLGKARRFSLGSYPAMGISAAREAARATRHKVKHEGADPIAEKRRNVTIGKQSKAGVGTLKALLDTYEAHGNPPKSWYPGRPRVELVFKEALGQPCAMLTIGDLQFEADRYHFPKSAAFAVRTLRPVLKWAAQPGRAHIQHELAQLIPPAKIKPRKRILVNDEIRAVLPLLRDSDRPHNRMLHFLLLTLSRREEAGVARWRHVDLKAGTWLIPKPKNTEPHVVPLSTQARDLLAEIGPGKPDELIFRTESGAHLGNWDRETKRIIVASGLGVRDKKTGVTAMKDNSVTWHRHDLRRTGATMLGELGVLPDIVGAALNHTSIRSPLAATYNRSRYRPQVAAALQLLADELDKIIATPVKLAALSGLLAGDDWPISCGHDLCPHAPNGSLADLCQ